MNSGPDPRNLSGATKGLGLLGFGVQGGTELTCDPNKCHTTALDCLRGLSCQNLRLSDILQ